MSKKIKIAFLGIRGIPASYGGFETFVEELGHLLHEKNYDVTVYCRRGNAESDLKTYRGCKLRTLPTIRHKYLDTIFHTFLSSIDVMFRSYDIVYYCNAINASFLIFPRISFKKTLINVNGLEWKRAKWSSMGKRAYRISEKIATVLANYIISDSRGIQNYYKEKFNQETVFLPYGAKESKIKDSEKYLSELGLETRNYILYVSRLEPENNALAFIQAYEKIKTDKPLIIVGSAPYASKYIGQLKSTKDKRIRFFGSVYGDGYIHLQQNAYIYLHGNEVGGTNPALLEAMIRGNCVIVNGVSFNREVVGDAGYCYEPGDIKSLQGVMQKLIDDPYLVESVREKARQRIRENYSWDSIADEYDQFFKKILNR